MARRVRLMVRLGREFPELSPGLLFSDTEPRLPGQIPPYPWGRGHPAGLHPTVRRGPARRTAGRVHRAPVRGRGPHSRRQAPRLHAFNARARSRTLSVLPRIPPGRCRRRHDPGGGPVAGPPPKTCIPSGGGPCTAGHPEPGLQTTGRVRATPDAWPWHPLAGREPSRPDVVSAVSRRPPLPLECRFPTWQRLRVPSRSRTASETPGWP